MTRTGSTGEFQHEFKHQNYWLEVCNGWPKKKVVRVKHCLRLHQPGFVAILCTLCFIVAMEASAQNPNQAQSTRDLAPSAFPATVPPSGVEGGNVVAATGDADLASSKPEATGAGQQ